MIRGAVLLLLGLFNACDAGSIASAFCNDKNTTTPIVKGDQTYICVNINDSYRVVFAPVVDKYVQLRLHDSYVDSRLKTTGNSSTFMTISSMASRSVYKMYTNSKGKAYPILTAVVTVKQGEIQGISWDDGCYLCDYAECDANIYSTPYSPLLNSVLGDGSTCYHTPIQCANTTGLCDLAIYIGWTGTDANGDYLSSAGMRISQFQKYSVTSYLNDFQSKLTSLLPRF
ncbi:unnamed protein product [Aphanomyces euteiches]|uniref:Uncharacterized protein n=1 Tax=Aphanomyces euteiches TaxID=100861 RepID=A0A6G0XHS2_9STRA|nr:hypothetical protein Ae201684_004605 [Aphanomyces euteiches]KAH9093683.1 hypothetical protein Ae201684P_016308 [Aphanomyces euteiches]KAH9147996.1 hypothetical protein AeRB84_008491 [Aphanomyces euteiches]KAH9148000.1 hypothetical protein AeRB84_008495 [Aphanomyces euteiches]